MRSTNPVIVIKWPRVYRQLGGSVVLDQAWGDYPSAGPVIVCETGQL